MNTESELDQWDYQLILISKRYNDHGNIDRAIELWSHRNKIDKSSVWVGDIVYRLNEIFHIIAPDKMFEVIENAAPRKDWLYSGYKFSDTGNTYYYERFLLAYLSILRYIKTKNIPGLDEYYNNVWAKEGKS